MEESNRLKVILDTSVMMEDCFSWIEENWQKYEFIIVNVMRSELNGLKDGKDSEKRYKARKALKFIKNNIDKFTFANHPYLSSLSSELYECTVDNILLDTCISRKAAIATNDINIIIDALLLDIEVVNVDVGSIADYKGWIEFTGNSDEVNEFFEDIPNKKLLNNQYIIVYNTDLNESCEYRYFDKELVPLKLPPSKVIKAWNSHQRCALDLLYNPNIPIKIICGTYGSGKTLLSVRTGLHMQEKGIYNKILLVRNPIGSGEDIGFLPGSKEEKIHDFYKPIEQNMEDGVFKLQGMIQREEVSCEIPFYMKGMDIKDTYVLVDEAEDLDLKTIKLIGTRINKDSCIVFAGDYKQAEKPYAKNNGLQKLIEATKGNSLVGIVMLKEDVRSEASKVFAGLE